MAVISFHTLEGGQRLVGPGRTLTDADMTMACMVTGDWHPIHCDVEYARETPTGKPVLHGGYAIAVALGMAARLLEFEEPRVMVIGLKEWSFKAPLVVGDTIHLEMVLNSKRPTGDGRRGIMEFKQRLINQWDATVMEGLSTHMVYFESAV